MKPRFKPLERPEGEDIWFCHSNHNEYHTSAFNKALSQIPDLNNGKDNSDLAKEQPKTLVKGSIHPNDSKYIRLAKAGGRKQLLAFFENPEERRSPQPYPVPDWYGHYEGTKKGNGVVVKCPQRPDWMTYLDKDTDDKTNQYDPNRGIIAWDTMSSWKRDQFENEIQLKAKSTYDQRKKKQNKIVKPNTKVNTNNKPTKEGKLKLPNITKSQLNGFRKLSGTELATQWYKKWYLIGQG